MPSFDIQQLVDRAADIADMDGNFVEPETWVDWYNNAARALSLFLTRNNYLNYNSDIFTANWNIDEANSEFGMIDGGDFSGPACAVIGVFEVRDNKYRRLRHKQLPDLAINLGDLTARPEGTSHFYSVAVNSNALVSVILEPKPTSGNYVAVFLLDRGTQDALDDTVNWAFGFEQRIVLEMAKMALIKENSDTSQIDDLIAKEEQRIEEQCWALAHRDGLKVRNVDSTERGWGSWDDSLTYGTWDSWYWL